MPTPTPTTTLSRLPEPRQTVLLRSTTNSTALAADTPLANTIDHAKSNADMMARWNEAAAGATDEAAAMAALLEQGRARATAELEMATQTQARESRALDHESSLAQLSAEDWNGLIVSTRSDCEYNLYSRRWTSGADFFMGS